MRQHLPQHQKARCYRQFRAQSVQVWLRLVAKGILWGLSAVVHNEATNRRCRLEAHAADLYNVSCVVKGFHSPRESQYHNCPFSRRAVLFLEVGQITSREPCCCPAKTCVSHESWIWQVDIVRLAIINRDSIAKMRRTTSPAPGRVRPAQSNDGRTRRRLVGRVECVALVA